MKPLQRYIKKSQANGPNGAAAVVDVADLAHTYSKPNSVAGNEIRSQDMKRLIAAIQSQIKQRLLLAKDDLDWLALVAHPLGGAVDMKRLYDYAAYGGEAVVKGRCKNVGWGAGAEPELF